MATTVDQLYGAEHFDSPYFEVLKRWLATQEFKRGVEIGFAWGMSAMAFLETQAAPLTSIDLNDNMKKAGRVKELFNRFEFIEGDSAKTLAKLDGLFDYIYIDGDHEYPQVKLDLEAAHKKLAKDGVIVCDDYGNPCGVKQAVDEFCKKYGYSLEVMDGNPNGGVILKREKKNGKLAKSTSKH